jgi:hypothetical protein
VSVNPVGELNKKPSQVLDYRLHGHKLNLLCLWDFVAQIEKVCLSKVHACKSAEDRLVDSSTISTISEICQ